MTSRGLKEYFIASRDWRLTPLSSRLWTGGRLLYPALKRPASAGGSVLQLSCCASKRSPPDQLGFVVSIVESICDVASRVSYSSDSSTWLEGALPLVENRCVWPALLLGLPMESQHCSCVCPYQVGPLWGIPTIM